MTFRLSLMQRRSAGRARDQGRTRRSRRNWAMEGLEGRFLLASPTVYSVNVATDSVPASGGLSGGSGSGTTGDLRYVINQANTNPNHAGSVIQFDPAVFSASTPRTITPSFGLALLETAGPVVIDGPGANIVTINGGNAPGVNPGVFLVENGGVTARIAGLTISGGGVGINNWGTLAVSECIIASNGGGITNRGTLAASGCTIANNSRGITNEGTLAASGCTIANNSGGGGISNSGTMTIVNCTIAQNNATIWGGGIFTTGTMTIVNCTIAYNTAFSGAGLWIERGAVTLNNTIVALNSDSQGLPGVGSFEDDVSGGAPPVSAAHNLIGTAASGGVKRKAKGKGKTGGTLRLGLGLLADHGGPTPTIALLPGSPALGAGSVALAVDPATGLPLTTDQRGTGFPRIMNGSVDIGAYQSQATSHSAAPPTIAGVPILTAGKGDLGRISGLKLFFSAALKAARARRAANYIVTQTVQHGGQTVTQRVRLQARYRPNSETVSLILRGRPSFALGGQILVRGSSPSGITGTSGVYLDGSGQGSPGSDAVFVILPDGGGVVR